jgi:hypothetical protein
MPVAGRGPANTANDARTGDALEGIVEVAEVESSRPGLRPGPVRGLIIDLFSTEFTAMVNCGAVLYFPASERA